MTQQANQCPHRAPCAERCASDNQPAHTIHTCADRHCFACHSAEVHIDALLARRKAAALRAEAARLDAQGGLDGPEFGGISYKELEF